VIVQYVGGRSQDGDGSPRLPRGGRATNDSAMSSHGNSSGRRTKAETSSKQLMYGMAHRTLRRSCFYLAERFTLERAIYDSLVRVQKNTSDILCES
jgi:hypothetical protein